MRHYLVLCALIGWGLEQAISAKADTIIASLPGDFSTTLNTDTSTWSYRYRPDRDLTKDYLLLPSYGNSPGTWTPLNPMSWNVGNNAPEIGRNLTSGAASNSTASPTDAFTVTGGTLWMRPGDGQLAVISFLYPLDVPKVVKIQYTFAGLHLSGIGNGFSFLRELRLSDGTSSVRGDAVGGGGGGSGSISLDMKPGDRYYFILDPSVNGVQSDTGAAFDAMSVSIIVTVPEPSTLALAGIASLSLLITARRRRLFIWGRVRRAP